MRKYFIIIFIIKTMVVLCNGDMVRNLSKDNYLETIPNWKKGDTYKYIINHERKSIFNNQINIIQKNTSEIKIRIIEELINGYKLSIDITKIENNLQNGLEPVTIDKNLNFTTFYITDKKGKIIGIENWKEISEIMKNFTKSLLKNIDNEEKKNQILNVSEAIYKDEKAILNLLSKNYGIFFMYFGLILEYGKEYEIDSYLPNPFESRPIPAIVVTKSVQAEDNISLINIVNKIDTNAAQDVIVSIMKKIHPNNFHNNKLDEIEFFNMTDNFNIKYNELVTMADEIYFSRSFIIKGEKQIDEYYIERLK